jgi:cyclophilin family peptidyl-prolyl cis-trans isomerase
MKRAIFTIFAFLLFLLCISAQNKEVKPMCIKIFTTEGNIKVILYDDTPEHKYNFLQLVKFKTYEGLLFHRVIKNFMIQGGDPESKGCDSTKILGSGGNGYTLPAEIRFPQHFHKRGALAAARTNNPEKRSSGCQFYLVTGKTATDKELDFFEQNINNQMLPATPLKYTEEQRRIYKTFGGTPHLDGSYTVFGEIVDGFDVLEKIQAIPTDKNDRPKKDVVILKMKIVKK